MTDYNPDVYWTVNNVTYYRKIDALIASNCNGQSHVTFNYYNDKFSQCDWLHEPTETFAQLLKQRAQQLRDNNKYVRIWYSGGADSHTMLQAFLDNDIYMDEIVLIRTSPIDDFDTKASREANLRSIPYINSIKHMIPRTKISLVDITAKHYMNMYKNTDWLSETNSFTFSDDPGILLGSRDGIERYTQLTIHEDSAEVTGGDKPKVLRKDGIYYIALTDSQFNYLYWADVKEFFTTPEMPELHAKQCYEWINVLERRFPNNQDLTNDIYNPLTMTAEFKKEWYHCCRQIINYDVDFGKGWKLHSPKVQYKVDEAKANNPELLKYFIGSLQEVQPLVSHYWEDFDNGMTGVLAGIYTFGPYNKLDK